MKLAGCYLINGKRGTKGKEKGSARETCLLYLQGSPDPGTVGVTQAFVLIHLLRARRVRKVAGKASFFWYTTDFLQPATGSPKMCHLTK